MSRNAIYYAFFCALWQLSCGDRVRDHEPPLPAVIVATQQQIDTLQVVAARYIVLFKARPGMEQVRFSSFHAETVHFSPMLNAKYHYEAGIRDIRMISAVELPSLQEETATPLTALNWQRAPRTPAGIITEVHFTSNAVAGAHLQRWLERGDIYFAEPVYISQVKTSHSPQPPAEEDNTAGGYVSLADEYEEYQAVKADNFWWHKKIELATAMRHIADTKKNSGNARSGYREWDEIQDRNNQPIIAVFDSGVDYEHPALKDRMYVRTGGNDLFCGEDKYGCNTTNPEKGQLGDGQARPWGTNKSWAQRLKGKDAEAGGACPSGKEDGKKGEFASCSHGTHVAGIIAADGRIARGRCAAAGVCPFCRILNIRVVSGVGPLGPEDSKSGGITDTSILNGLKYVYELWLDRIEVRVINASIGKFHRSRAVALLIKNLRKQSSTSGGDGLLVVGAAGNEDTMARTYPAALDDVLAVAATDSSGRKSKFSNFGVWVDIAAPGGGIFNKICSTVPGGAYEGQAGTSMSTPVVAGVAGLLVAVHSDKISANTIRDILQFNSKPDELYPEKEEDGTDGSNKKYYLTKLDNTEHPVPLLGYGLLNARAALLNEHNAKDFIERDDEYRIDLTSCATVAATPSSTLLWLLLPLPLVLLLRRLME